MPDLLDNFPRDRADLATKLRLVANTTRLQSLRESIILYHFQMVSLLRFDTPFAIAQNAQRSRRALDDAYPLGINLSTSLAVVLVQSQKLFAGDALQWAGGRSKECAGMDLRAPYTRHAVSHGRSI